MDEELAGSLWRQFGAALDMIERAIRACPEELWSDRSCPRPFWYVSYHTLFFVDFYSTALEASEFQPPPPFTLSEADPSGRMPDRVYTRDELLAYLDYGRHQVRRQIESLDAESARRIRRFHWVEMSLFELILYNLRHVQHHAGQLNLLLRQGIDAAPRWVRWEGDHR